MKLVIFGLAVSSSWGKWPRGPMARPDPRICQTRPLGRIFERNVPYYAQNRDLTSLEGGRLVLYSGWEEVLPEARRALSDADAGMVTSYCPDALAATDLLLDAPSLHVFYDLDTPVTLAELAAGKQVDYIGPDGLAPFDLVLSYTGGTALTALRQKLGAKRVAPLYGSVDPDRYRPAAAPDRGRAALSYLGTYADDRQDALNAFFIEPARQRPEAHFVIGGAQYPADFPWAENIFFFRHLASYQHPEFYASARLTLNVTRPAMASFGWCASGRLFEASACAAPIISDWWEGLDEFFVPDREILIARTTDDVLAALDRSNAELTAIGTAGLERTLAAHTAEHRAIELEMLLSQHWE